MASNIILFDANESTTSYYLSGSTRTSYTGSGSPWTAQATTPIRIGNNETTGTPWTPKVGEQVGVYTGGRIVGVENGVVTEQIPIQIYASTLDNAIAVKIRLERALNRAVSYRPSRLQVQVDTQTNVGYADVYRGTIQEHPYFINDEAGRGVLRAMMTLERSFWFGTQGSFTTATMSGTTWGNAGGATTANREFPATFLGEGEEGGVPLNIALSSFSATTMTKLFVCNRYSYTNNTDSAGAASSPSTTTGALIGTTRTTSVDLGLQQMLNLKPRVLVHFSAVASNAEVRMGVALGLQATTPQWYSPWIDPPDSATLVDFGTWPIDRAVANDQDAYSIFIYVRSTNGASASVTLTRNHMLTYWQFATVETAFDANTNGLELRSVGGGTTNAVLDKPDFAYQLRSSGVQQSCLIRGELPRGYGFTPFLGQLWMSWLGTAGLFTTTETLTGAVTYAPTWKSFRGTL